MSPPLTRGIAAGLCALLIPAGATAACVVLDAHPEAQALAAFALPEPDPEFALTYVHSVTRTPVEETYRVTAAGLVQTGIRFEQHGPGLPTAADAGGDWERRDGQFVVRMRRPLDGIVMRVHADQSPRLVVAGRAVPLAQWGNRALALSTRGGACPPSP